jgi:hypothetical protein
MTSIEGSNIIVGKFDRHASVFLGCGQLVLELKKLKGNKINDHWNDYGKSIF